MQATLTTDELLLETKALKNAALVLRALNHKLRMQMVQFIHQSGRMTVTSIYIKLRVEQSVASQHLAILRKQGVVNTEREGKFIFYSVNYQRMKELETVAGRLVEIENQLIAKRDKPKPAPNKLTPGDYSNQPLLAAITKLF